MIFNIAVVLIAKMIKRLKLLPKAMFLVFLGTRTAVVINIGETCYPSLLPTSNLPRIAANRR